MAILAIILMVLIDQGVKLWAVNSLQAVGTIPVINDVFHLTYIENRGAAFSIGQNRVPFFILVTFIILIVMLVALKKGMVKTQLGKISIYIIIGGALGNLIDRIMRGFVVDMFDFRLINFPVFNVADIFVCIGCVLFCWYVLYQHDKVK